MSHFPHAAANPEQIVIEGEARFTILTPALIRLEWSPGGQFEDRPSFTFVHRRQPVADYTVRNDKTWLKIETDNLSLSYLKGSGKFSARSLRIQLKSMPGAPGWHPGMKDTGNLGGTVRTLDKVSGATPVGPGLLSREGWSLVDDSAALLFGEGEPAWAEPRRAPGAIDWYFFGHGRDYKAALRDYALIAGAIPLPPRYVFGAWWSRYWAYSDAELSDLVGQYRTHDVPLDVLVVDMDWHLDGWSGYTWNPKFFPDPEGFLRWCHEQNLKVTLNLHPHDGVGKHEACFPAMADAMGVDPGSVDRIPFSPADPRYMRAYFDILHHPLERQGVDFWWIDWQQGTDSGMAGLDPLFWLNHLHWEDMANNPERGDARPLIFSRWGGLGNHRYQIGFSGDTFCDWESLAFQPYFTATAGNVAYPFWSHDIGGHQPGPVEGELYARWIQYAAFNPVLRTHTTKNPEAERRIWAFEPEIFEAARAAFRLRYALIPYIYTAARQCHEEALPLCRPLYYDWPEVEESYRFTGEYMFGDDLLVVPVVSPRDEATGLAVSRVWLPPGEWHHWFTTETFEGPCEVTLHTPLDQIPVFARSGAIIPMIPPAQRIPAAYDHVILRVFAGDSGAAHLYEDDGESKGYMRGEFGFTEISYTRTAQSADDARHEIQIGATRGEWKGRPAMRRWELHLPGVRMDDVVWTDDEIVPRRDGPPGEGESGWHRDTDGQTAIIVLDRLPTSHPHRIVIGRVK